MTGSIYVGVRDLAAALAWYKEKLELQEPPKPIDQEIGDAAQWCLTKAKYSLPLARRTPQTWRHASSPSKTHKRSGTALAARGVKVGPLQTDRQGTHYFEMRDLEDNMIEFLAQEP